MNETIENVGWKLNDDVAPVSPAVLGEFVIRLGEGRGGSLHDLAGELERCEGGAEAAAAGLLSWLEFVEVDA